MSAEDPPAGGQPEPAGIQADPYAPGVERFRETAKWLVTVFAAIGATLLAGTQLSSLGQVEDPTRLPIALVSAAIGLVAVGAVVWSASRVLAGDPVLLSVLLAEDRTAGAGGVARGPELKFVYENRQLLDRYRSIVELAEDYDRVVGERDAALDARDFDRTKEKENRKIYLDQVTTGLLRAVRYDRTLRQYRAAVRTMLICGSVGAACIVAFAWAANPPEAEQTEPPPTEQG